MKTSNEILDAVARELGGVSDYRVCVEVGIRPQMMSHVRNGRRFLPPSECKKAAKVLGVEPAVLITIVNAEREDDQDIKKSLYRLAARGMAAAVVLALSAGLSAGYAPTAQASGARDVYYVKSNRRRKKNDPKPWRRVPQRRAPLQIVAQAERQFTRRA